MSTGRRKLGAGLLAATVLSLGTVDVGTASAQIVMPTVSPTQLVCLIGQHLDTAALAHPTDEAVDALIAAAGACGVALSDELIAELRHQVDLTDGSVDPSDDDDADADCMANQGLADPLPGQAPTPQQIVQFTAALINCGIITPAAKPTPPATPPAAHRPALTPKQAAAARKALLKAAAERKKAAARAAAIARKAAQAKRKAAQKAAQRAAKAAKGRGAARG